MEASPAPPFVAAGVAEKQFEGALRRWKLLKKRYGQGSAKPWRQIPDHDDCGDGKEGDRNATATISEGSSSGGGGGGGGDFASDDRRELDAVMALVHEAAGAHGLAQAQWPLGSMYEHGHGVPRDAAAAMQWYRKAAEQGHAKAQYSLGCLCAAHPVCGSSSLSPPDGAGKKKKKKDLSEALHWLRKAEAQGDEHATHAIQQVLHMQGRTAGEGGGGT